MNSHPTPETTNPKTWIEDALEDSHQVRQAHRGVMVQDLAEVLGQNRRRQRAADREQFGSRLDEEDDVGDVLIDSPQTTTHHHHQAPPTATRSRLPGWGLAALLAGSGLLGAGLPLAVRVGSAMLDRVDRPSPTTPAVPAIPTEPPPSPPKVRPPASPAPIQPPSIRLRVVD